MTYWARFLLNAHKQKHNSTEGTATLGLYKYQGLHLVINERRQSTVLVGCPTTTIKLLFSQTCRVLF